MASWRVKGYVSDSEDEDGGIEPRERVCPIVQDSYGTRAPDTDNDILQSTPTTPELGQTLRPEDAEIPVDLTTAEKLQKCLEEASEIVRSISQISASQEYGAASNHEDDSPLSTPPRSPQLFSMVESASIENLVVAEEDSSVLLQAPQRMLRHRTANQLQPYTIDRARHVKQWTAIGMKPIGLPRSRSPLPEATRSTTQDSQFEESQTQSQSQFADSNSQDPMDVDLVSAPAMNDAHVYEFDPDDELPDLANILKRKHPRSAKKLGLFNASSSDSELPRTSKSKSKTARPLTNVLNQQDSLPSPPLSLNMEPLRQDAISVSEEMDISTPAVPTSSSRPRKRPIVEDDTQSANEEHPHSTDNVVEIHDSSSSSSEDDSDGNDTQVMQKRIKGVLPASWWTVEMAQKSLTANKKTIPRPNFSRIPHAGVAQRMTNTRFDPASTRSHDLMELVSDSSSEEESPKKAAVPTTSHLTQSPEHQGFNLDIYGDGATEDNGFDAMLVPQSRRRGPLTKSSAIQHATPTRSTKKKQPLKQSRSLTIDGLHRKRAKARSTYNRIHVLDAPGLQVSRQNLPSFLRVAARQAKTKSLGTLQSRKFIELGDDDQSGQIFDHISEAVKRNRVAGTSRAISSHRNHTTKGLRGTNTRYRPDMGRRSAFGADHGRELPPEATPRSEPGEKFGKAAALGHLVQCDPSEDATLRLTRLQNLLPLTNRSGHGMLDARQAQPREAQMEVVQPIAKSFRHRHRRIIRMPIVDINQHQGADTDVHDLTQPGLVQATRNGQRKQIPVQLPKLRQASLISLKLDTTALSSLVGKSDVSVRDSLEREFNTHQAAWFQASQRNIVYSNQATQEHFYTFLEVLKSYLPAALQNAEDDRESRELRSFIHRLIPNRGQIGASGQVGNKKRSVHEYDIVVARNVFDLHKCLLSLAPGSAPRPRVLEMKVSFADAHEEICAIALTTWTEIYELHISDTDILRGLSSWIYSMISQLATRWVAAETDAEREAGGLTHRINEEVVRKVIEHNQRGVGDLLCKVLTSLTHAIQCATSVLEARSIFSADDFTRIFDQLMRLNRLKSSVVESIFSIAATYFGQPWVSPEVSEVSQVLNAYRQALSTLTSRDSLSVDTIVSVSKSFFAVFYAAVKAGQRDWDELLTPVSPHSLETFVDSNCIRIFKSVLFCALIEQDHTQYMMEFRSVVIAFWITILLAAKEEDKQCRMLTSSLFRNEKESLGLSKLAAKFDDYDLSEFSLSEVRHAAVLHVITALHDQENNAEAEWLPSGFEEADAQRLLKSMFAVMRETWVSLIDFPEEQQIYTLLIHGALGQFELYPRQDVTIDPWFCNAATFPQPVKNDLFQVLRGEVVPEGDMVENARNLFRLEIQHASRFGTFEALEERFKGLFVNQLEDSLEGRTERLVEHGKFLCLALDHCIGDSSPDNRRAAEVLVRTVVGLMENLHCHVEANNTRAMEDFVLNILPMLSTLRGLLDEADMACKTEIFVLVSVVYRWTIACLSDVPDSSMNDLEAICDIAAADGSPQALSLLLTVMSLGQT